MSLYNRLKKKIAKLEKNIEKKQKEIEKLKIEYEKKLISDYDLMSQKRRIEEKIKTITESLKKNNIIVNKKGRVIIDDDLCIDCGACVSLCPTDALYLDDEERVSLFYERCIGCLLCVDSCPRIAIEEM